MMKIFVCKQLKFRLNGVMINFLFFISLFILPISGISAQLPRQLTESDRSVALKILGFGTATKLNAEPTPLGGYEGFEFFVSTDLIPIQDVQNLGNRSGTGDQLLTTSFGFGKGIFFDVDTFVYFSPLQWQSKYSQIGGYVRKVVYTSEDKPFQVAFNLHGNGTSIENLVHLRTTGLDAILSYEWPQVTLSLGGGIGRSIGTFIGGSNGNGINSTTETYTNDIQQQHLLISLAKGWGKNYLSLQYDRYFDASYSLKYGFRL